MAETILDLLLAFTLLFLAWRLLSAKDIFVSIVLFIVFGLVTGLIWVRLQAPDIALVEAGIGAGLTGALFLGVLGRLESELTTTALESYSSLKKWQKSILWIFTTFFGGILCFSISTLPTHASGLGKVLRPLLPEVGVENQVSSVILNFRSYDALLEIGLLFLVTMALYALFSFEPHFSSLHLPPRRQVLTAFLHLMIPLMILTPFYFLWIGSHAPGGAFQAGAILGGAGILLLLGGVRLPTNLYWRVWRFALTFGFIGFMFVGFVVVSKERNFLEYPKGMTEVLILTIEVMSALSIASIFISLFALCSGLYSVNEKEI